MKTSTQPLQALKSKKDFILAFLAGSHPSDKTEAFTAFGADKNNPTVSTAFFNKCWQELKGHTPKAEKVVKDADAIRDQIGKMFTEQQEMFKTVSQYHIEGVLTDDVQKKKELKVLEEAAFDKVMAFNRTIRGFMEANHQ